MLENSKKGSQKETLPHQGCSGVVVVLLTHRVASNQSNVETFCCLRPGIANSVSEKNNAEKITGPKK